MKHIRSLFRNIRFRKRQSYYQRKVKSVDSTISLISSNCWAGFLYHDMGLPFLTPTINLTFDPNDYLYFCQHLAEIKHAVLREDKTNEFNYIVGTLTFPDSQKKIKIHFVHYSSFNEASDAFYRRVKRINFKNYICLFNVFNLTKNLANGFRQIPAKKICVFVNSEDGCDATSQNNCLFFCLNSKIPHNKDMLSFKHALGRKMYIDDIDFDFHSYIFSKNNN